MHDRIHMSRQAVRVNMDIIIIKQKYIRDESCLAHPPVTPFKTALNFQPFKDREFPVCAIVKIS